MKVIYKAEDGTEFESEALCKDHEASQSIESTLSGLSPGEIAYALEYSSAKNSRRISAAIEKAARIIAIARIAAGDAKRKRKPKVEDAPVEVVTEKAMAEIAAGVSLDIPAYPSKDNPFPNRKTA